MSGDAAVPTATADMRVTLGTPGKIVERVVCLAPGLGLVVLVDVASGADWSSAVEGMSRSLLGHLADLPQGPVVVATRMPTGAASPVQAAAAAAVRGTVGVAALEAAPRGQRVNTVVFDDRTADDDLRAALAYLADDTAAGFTAGATLDLTRSGIEPTPQDDLPVLVTGAAGGLGGAVAEAFVAAGRRVIISDLDSDSLAEQAERLGVVAIPCDVTSPEAVRALADHSELSGGISCLQLIHGVGGSGSLDTLDEGVRERSLRINGTGVWNLVEALAPLVRTGEGSIVVLSSQAGLIAEAGNGAYCAAKFAAVGLVQALVDEPGQDIRVHTICPGPIDTPLMRAAFTGMAEQAGVSYDEYHARRASEIPLGRFGQPEHIGAAALLLSGLRATGVVVAPTGAFLLT